MPVFIPAGRDEGLSSFFVASRLGIREAVMGYKGRYSGLVDGRYSGQPGLNRQESEFDVCSCFEGK